MGLYGPMLFRHFPNSFGIVFISIQIYFLLLSEGFVIKPMTSCMAGLFCIYNNLCLMLYRSNAEKHQVSFSSIMQLPGLEITSVWLCSSGLRHLMMLQSRLQLSRRLLKDVQSWRAGFQGPVFHHQKGGPGCWWKAIAFCT